MKVKKAREVYRRLKEELSGKYQRIAIVGECRTWEEEVEKVQVLISPLYNEVIIDKQLGLWKDVESRRVESMIAAWVTDIGYGSNKRYGYWGGKEVMEEETRAIIEIFQISRIEKWGIAICRLTHQNDIWDMINAYVLWKHWHIVNDMLHLHDRGGFGGKKNCGKGDRCILARGFIEEEHFFEFCGIPWVTPSRRTASYYYNDLKRRLGI